jgi:hypothetical protein
MLIDPQVRLAPAVADYRWLLDRGYPDEGSIKLVGDRYRLTGPERGMLYRGVFSRADSSRRAARLVDPGDAGAMPSVGELTVDGHNVLFTVWNCLAGRPVVLATDGFIRDVGGTRARLPHDERFARLALVVCRTLAALPLRTVTVLLDDPLPWSRDHGTVIEQTWRDVSGHAAPELSAVTSRSVDAVVARTLRGAIATSDTAIIDRCRVPVLDLGGLIVRSALRAHPVSMAELADSR